MSTSDLIKTIETALTIAVQLAVNSERDERDEPEAAAGLKALASLVAQVSILERENAALRAFVGIPDGVTVASVEDIMKLPCTFGLPIETLLKAAARSTKPVIRIVDSESKSPDT